VALFRRRPLFERRPDGRFDLHLATDERRLLAGLADQLETLLDAETEDPALRRLFPAAYSNDPEREAEWQVLMGDDLRDSRRAALETLRVTATRTEVTEDEVTAWMQAVNSIRLVLGTRLDVSEEDTGDRPPDDPNAQAFALYGFLSYLLDRTVDSLSG
jgi:hypothetical protein